MTELDKSGETGRIQEMLSSLQELESAPATDKDETYTLPEGFAKVVDQMAEIFGEDSSSMALRLMVRGLDSMLDEGECFVELADAGVDPSVVVPYLDLVDSIVRENIPPED